VTSVPVERGDTVTTSTAIAKVGVIDNLEIDVNLPEADSAKAKKGMSAKVELEAFPGESFDATVTKVSPVLDPTSRTRQIVLSFAKKDGRIAAGMYANVRLFTEEDVGHFVVPSTSIISRDGEDSVFVAVTDESGKKVAKKKVIKFGISVDNQTAITKGLAVGDMVVYEGQDLLADGSEVTIIDGDGK
jgi:RND family efflux transporter MFP subunit